VGRGDVVDLSRSNKHFIDDLKTLAI